MKCFVDLEGKIPAKDGDPVALVIVDGDARVTHRTASKRPILRLDSDGDHCLEMDGVDDCITLAPAHNG